MNSPLNIDRLASALDAVPWPEPREARPTHFVLGVRGRPLMWRAEVGRKDGLMVSGRAFTPERALIVATLTWLERVYVDAGAPIDETAAAAQFIRLRLTN